MAPKQTSKSKSSSKAANPLDIPFLSPLPAPEDLPDGSEWAPDDTRGFIGRDLSWLAFNARVLDQATDKRNPLLERVKFLAIFANNLDEFFMKRVGLIRRRIAEGRERRSADGLTVREQFAEFRNTAVKLEAAAAKILEQSLQPELSDKGIELATYTDLPRKVRARVDAFFREHIFPLLTPLAVDKGHRFPFISNLSENLGIIVQPPDSKERLFARIKIPEALPRLIAVPENADLKVGEVQDPRSVRFVSLDEVVRQNMDALFPGMAIVDVIAFRVTRAAGVDHDDNDFDDLLERVEADLHSRRFAEAVRIEVLNDASSPIIELLLEELQLTHEDLYIRQGRLDYQDLMELASLHRPKLKDKPFRGVIPPKLASEEQSIFEIIKERDILLHHPYESFRHSVERFVDEAASDPAVLAIKQTLYRTSRDSPFIESLIRAAEDGKQVACLVELRARFDEDKNVRFARQLEKHGVHVAYGVLGLKTHSKCSLVVRKEGKGLKTYAHVGTGNYHPGTAQLYTDTGLLTADPAITQDVAQLFNELTGRTHELDYQTLLVAPRHMRQRFLELIDREIEHARNGRPACVTVKMNQLEDAEIIKRLVLASRENVKVHGIVRGFTTIRPGIPGYSDNIHIHSVIGRFLEHSRIFHFANGNADPIEGSFFIGSADWMERNLSARVEVIAPVRDLSARQHLWQILDTGWRDKRNAYILNPTGTYTRDQPSFDRGEDAPEAIGTFETLIKHARASNSPTLS